MVIAGGGLRRKKAHHLFTFIGTNAPPLHVEPSKHLFAGLFSSGRTDAVAGAFHAALAAQPLDENLARVKKLGNHFLSGSYVRAH